MTRRETPGRERACVVQPPLWRNRDFNLLWGGQVLSDLGARVSGVAFPLLVLALTESPAKAGIVAAAGSLPLLVLTLPGGALVDRWNRKTVMIAADSARCLALSSVVLALAAEALTFPHIVAVAVVEGAGFVFFNVAERSALARVVPVDQLADAVARNQTREYGALLAGAPLGGLLFGAGRIFPFVFDAVSYFVSVLTVALIRTDFRRDRTAVERVSLLREMAAGIRWFWRQRFVRATSLLATGTDFALNGFYLVVIVLARERGASPALVGAMFVFLGMGGIAGSLAAPWLTRRLSPRALIVGAHSAVAALTPLLAVLPGRLAPGIVYGAMLVLLPALNAVVVAYRLRITPDELQARVSSIATAFSLGAVPVAYLTAGFLLEHAGSTPALLAFFALTVVVSLAAAMSRAIRTLPADVRPPAVSPAGRSQISRR